MEKVKKKNLFTRWLDGIERVGNALPHPATIFLILTAVLLAVSAICAGAGISATFQTVDTKTGETVEKTVAAVSLLSREGFIHMLTSVVKNFTGFAPLGTVVVSMIGVGVAEGTGLVGAVMQKTVMSAPEKLVTAVLVFIGVMANVAGDVSYVVLIPLGAIVFMGFGKHPLAGLYCGFASVSAGYLGNLVLSTSDPLLAGITQEAARLFDPSYEVLPTATYFFSVASVPMLVVIGTLVTEKIIIPRVGEYHGEGLSMEPLNDRQRKALKLAGLSLLIYVAVILCLLIPHDGILRGENGGIASSPFMSGLIPLMMLFFLIPGIVYGVVAGTVKSDKDVAALVAKSLSGLGGYLLLAFVASQFIDYFSFSNLATIIAISGANGLMKIGFVGLPLMLCFIVISSLINLIMGSASAKWALMAPVFVPLFMQFGISPEFTQCLYRIGDSSTNIITPLMSYFPMIVAFAQKYDKEAGIGTMISMMLPYSLCFLGGWFVMLIIWYVLGLPVGPMAPIYM